MLMRQLLTPANTSGRSKTQIVFDMETSILSPYIMDYNTEAHLESCRCNKCFQARLDSIVGMGEVV